MGKANSVQTGDEQYIKSLDRKREGKRPLGGIGM